MNELLTTTEVATMYGVTRQAVLCWVRRGWLPAQRLGGGKRKQVFITRQDAEAVQRPNPGPRPQVNLTEIKSLVIDIS